MKASLQDLALSEDRSADVCAVTSDGTRLTAWVTGDPGSGAAASRAGWPDAATGDDGYTDLELRNYWSGDGYGIAGSLTAWSLRASVGGDVSARARRRSSASSRRRQRAMLSP
jgi:hypothetical protein